MRRWDRLVERYVEEYAARGIGAATVAHTQHRLERWGRWLKGRRPRVSIEVIDAALITRYVASCSSFRAKALRCIEQHLPTRAANDDCFTGGPSTRTKFSYDAYGNAVTNGFDSYLFNAASQMTAVPSIPGTSYSYDGNGMRATATMSSGTTYSAYGQNGQLLLTKELPSDVTSEYYYLGERLVAKRAFGAGVDDDLDDDGLTDDVELLLGLNPSSAADASADLDGDGATNLAEYQAGALLNDADTDNDGMNDGYELRYGLNVTSIDSTNDPDGDSLTNLQESQLNTNPYDNDTDNDGVPDNLDPNPTFNPALIPIINFILEN